MIGYTTLGTNDLPRAAAFYDELFAVIGGKRLMEFDRGYAWGVSHDTPGFGVLRPFDGEPASVGNGVMVAIVGGIAAGFATEHLQKKPEAR